MDDKVFDEQYERAKLDAATADTLEPRIRQAYYDRESGLVVIGLQNGESFSFSPLTIEELARGSMDDLAQVEVSPSGDGLHWEKLDADIGLIALQREAHQGRSYNLVFKLFIFSEENNDWPYFGTMANTKEVRSLINEYFNH